MENKEYLMPFGVLKVIEFFCSLVAWSTAVSQYNESKNDYIFKNREAKPDFHITICIITWIFSLLWFALNMAGVKQVACRTMNGTIHIILGILVLVAGSLFADVFSSHPGDFHTFNAGATFGIITGLFLIVDAFLYIKDAVTEGGACEKPAETA